MVQKDGTDIIGTEAEIKALAGKASCLCLVLSLTSALMRYQNHFAQAAKMAPPNTHTVIALVDETTAPLFPVIRVPQLLLLRHGVIIAKRQLTFEVDNLIDHVRGITR